MLASNAAAPIAVRWVKARYDGTRAKSVQSHAEAGFAYYVLDKGDGKYIIAAHRHPSVEAIPPHLAMANTTECEYLDRLEAERHPSYAKDRPSQHYDHQPHDTRKDVYA